jgi:hypothetical protein
MTEELLKDYDDTSTELLSHLKRTFKTYNISTEWKQSPIKFIVIDGKSTRLDGNKKTLINKLVTEIKDEWSHLGEQKLKNTVKNYIDGINI